MRRVALGLACVVAGVCVAVAVTTSGSAVTQPPSGGTTLMLTSTQEGATQLHANPRGMWDYYGQLTNTNVKLRGSYRALCAALEPTPPPAPHPAFTGQVRASTTDSDRLTCTVVVLFGDPATTDGGSMVIEGVLNKPAGSELFAASSARLLAVTGGTGSDYDGSVGKAKAMGPNAMGSREILVIYW
jgi:hypothetical protein